MKIIRRVLNRRVSHQLKGTKIFLTHINLIKKNPYIYIIKKYFRSDSSGSNVHNRRKGKKLEGFLNK